MIVVEADSTELPSARLTNPLEANKIGVAMQARATGITAADSLPGYDCDACHNGKMRRGNLFGTCSTTIFSVKKEIADGLSVLFYTRDV